MDATLINNINERMTRADRLYVAGDLFVSAREDPEEYLSKIKPKIILILGNHDNDWLRRFDEDKLRRCRLEVYPELSLKRNKKEMHVSHFPHLAWNKSHFFAESLMVCGHIHRKRTESVAAELFPRLLCQFNAGVDVNGYRPVSLLEMIENNKSFYERSYTDEQWCALMDSVAKLTI